MKRLNCPACNKPTVEGKKWQLDRILGWQARLVANKIKYPRDEYKEKYNRSEKIIRKLGFYAGL